MPVDPVKVLSWALDEQLAKTEQLESRGAALTAAITEFFAALDAEPYSPSRYNEAKAALRREATTDDD